MILNALLLTIAVWYLIILLHNNILNSLIYFFKDEFVIFKNSLTFSLTFDLTTITCISYYDTINLPIIKLFFYRIKKKKED